MIDKWLFWIYYVVSLITLIFFAVLLATHLYLVSHNLTTIELHREHLYVIPKSIIEKI